MAYLSLRRRAAKAGLSLSRELRAPPSTGALQTGLLTVEVQPHGASGREAPVEGDNVTIPSSERNAVELAKPRRGAG
jgi:hypothetical protein